ncbi:MAG: hypothetical protein Kow0063_30900 [Anaerolineae bacterium]
MDTIEAIAYLGALMLFLVALFVLLESAGSPVRRPAEESGRLWRRSFLLWLDFVLVLAILVWRAT